MQTMRFLAVAFVSLGILHTGCSGMSVDEKPKADKADKTDKADKGDKPVPKDKVPGEPTKPEDEVKTKSGLRYVDLKKGDGAEAKTGKNVVVHYTGWLRTGKKFDSSRDSGEPFPFLLGGRVIKGWNEGVPGMKVGGKRKLFIPPDLGYGEDGFPPDIPPSAELIFEVELLEVK